MQLLFLFLLLTGPYLILTILGRGAQSLSISSTARSRIGVTLFFVVTSVGHFIRTEEMAAMVPHSIPYPVEIIYITGVLELLGAIGVWIPGLMRLTGFCLILMLILLLPANIYSAINRVDFGGHNVGPKYLLIRIPFQFLIIWWTYYATEQNWFGRKNQNGAAHKLQPEIRAGNG